MKKLITSVIFALLSIGVSKAQISAGSLQKSFCEVSSPEAFAMTKYGATHSSMYTGAFSYNIEIIIDSTKLFFISDVSLPLANKSYKVFVALSIFICSGFNTTSE